MGAFNSIHTGLFRMCKSLKNKPYHNICKLCPCLHNIINPSQIYPGVINLDLVLLGPMFIQHLGLIKSYKESLDLSSRESFLIFQKQEICSKELLWLFLNSPKEEKDLLSKLKTDVLVAKTQSFHS